MSKARFTPLDVYKILPRSNCRRCLPPSCLAFAAAVVAGSRKLSECPDLGQGAIDDFFAGYHCQGPEHKEANQAEFIDKLRKKMVDIDPAAVATPAQAGVRGRAALID